MTDYRTHITILPEHMRGAMLRWIEDAIHPGSFLTAILCNDLKGTYSSADYINAAHVKDYIMYLYNYAPSNCWGSPEEFAEWKGLNNVS